VLSKKIGIDLGTSMVRIYVKGEGIIVNEPAPMRDGVRSDFMVTEAMLRHLIGRALGRQRFFKPEVMVSVPSSVGSDERRAVTGAAIAAGARQAWLIDEPMAAAMGAGLPIAEQRPNAICDIGGGRTEVAVISLSGMVVSHAVRVGGNAIDDAIAAHVRDAHGVRIEARTAEAIKIAIGSAMRLHEPVRAQVRGRDTDTGLERSIELSSHELTPVIEKPLTLIVHAIRAVLDETPPELAADVKDRGVVLSGGGALLRGLDRYVSQHVGVPVVVAADSQTAVVRGTGLALDQFEVLKRNQTYIR